LAALLAKIIAPGEHATHGITRQSLLDRPHSQEVPGEPGHFVSMRGVE